MEMIKLPYVVEPSEELVLIGGQGIGSVELPKYGALQDDEDAFIIENEISIEKLAIDTAKAIEQKSETDEKTVIKTADALLSKDYEFFVDNLQELLDFSKQKKMLLKHENVVLVTAIIKFRLTSNWTIEHTKNPALLKPGLFARILEFAKNEQYAYMEDGGGEVEGDTTVVDAVIV
ncbi:hypothetical protein [Anabaena lutea]|uniref:Uncharacterized protein n=1 Tax=Anabaena lutea FACHB-196 TaxID=2692881 RepID=A0ABR8FMW6_9NOST|nr:hypothetical protein [Anabaena lutea]MBD2570056.1 hypothetical protein [Anabaena lutea FACHB-196]